MAVAICLGSSSNDSWQERKHSSSIMPVMPLVCSCIRNSCAAWVEHIRSYHGNNTLWFRAFEWLCAVIVALLIDRSSPNQERVGGKSLSVLYWGKCLNPKPEEQEQALYIWHKEMTNTLHNWTSRSLDALGCESETASLFSGVQGALHRPYI